MKLINFNLSCYLTTQERIDRLNLHIHLGKMDYQDVNDLIKLREARYLI